MRVRTLFATLLSLALAFGFVACKGDQGPAGAQGPAGPQGPAGAPGAPGAPGEDGGDLAQNCIACHSNNQVIANKIYQWENSVHATGGANARGESTSCAVCHSSQGFLEGKPNPTTMAPVEGPLPQNCYTCHKIHDTYTEDDWASTAPEPVTFWVGGETADIGKGNLCINCHQARIPTPALPTPGVDDDVEVNITSFRYGPHHGAQGVLFTGNAAYEVAGDAAYANSLHTTLVADACITCHMAKVAPARESGGHTFRVESESGALNFNGCVQCHTDLDKLATDVKDLQTEVEDLMKQLADGLVARGYLEASADPDELPERVVTGNTPNLLVGIIWNYKYILEDKSWGVHNPTYTRALLKNSIAALPPL